jgi:hypothetical protein
MINTPICTGTLYLEGITGTTNTTMNLAYLPKNTPIPIHPAQILQFSSSFDAETSILEKTLVNKYSVQVTSGSVYLLA